MTDYTNVSARAMLVQLHVSAWTARRFDKGATKQVNTQNAASDKAGRYNKHLLAGAKEHEELISACEALRDVHYGQTLPWSDKGSRLLPTANFFAYSEVMRKSFAIADEKLTAFVDAYPSLVDAAEKHHTALGKLFNRAEYPKAQDVRRRFSWTVDYDKVPDGDFRVDLPADQLSAIAAAVEARASLATQEAMRGAWERLAEAVARIHKASQPDGVVRGTLIENARNTCDVLGRLNVAGDERLEEMRARVERDLAQLDLVDLRNDDTLRADTAQKAKRILDAMSDYGFAPPMKTEAAA
jgi:hypothetical protein